VHPIFGTREFHGGLDIAAPNGASVRAAAGGVVWFVGVHLGNGLVVIIDHGHGVWTEYSHLSAALVCCAQRIAAGQVLGRVGSTGWSTGPHLFFEVRDHTVPVNPLAYLSPRVLQAVVR
jgi:murein DD-endopeptidase MepM/ murein hydrolase activator NlpD